MKLLQLNQLPAELRAVVSFKNIEAGQILFTEHEPAYAVFILESGHVQLVNYTEDGQKNNHYSVRIGESFTELALFNEHYVCIAIVNLPSRILVLLKQDSLTALKQHPGFTETSMAQLAQRLHERRSC